MILLCIVGILFLFALIMFIILTAIRKMDFPEKDKYRQIVFLLFGIFSVIIIMITGRFLLSIVNTIVQLPFWNMLWSKLQISQFVDFVTPVLIIVFINIISALLFLLIKLVVKKEAYRYETGSDQILGGIYSSLTSYFYDIDGSSNLLLDKRAVLKKVISYLKIVVLVFFAGEFFYIFFVACNNSMVDGFIQNAKYLHFTPVLAVLLFSELNSYLNGSLSKKEILEVEEVETETESDFDLLAKAYKNTFVSHFIDHQKFVDSDNGEKTTISDHDNYCLEFEKEPAIKALLQNSEKHLKRVCKNGLNTNLFQMLKHLYHGENVAINASVFSDAMIYLMTYLKEIINSGGTILFIGKTKRKCDRAMDFLNQQSYEETSVLQNSIIWNVQNIDSACGDDTTDILFAAPQDLLDDVKMDLKKDFFTRLTLTIIIDAQEIMLKDSFLPLLVGWELNYRVNNQQIQYMFLMEHCGSAARDAFCHTFQLEDIAIVNDTREIKGEVHQLFWKYEGEYPMQNHWLQASHSYYGNMVTLAAFGIHNGIKNVFLPSESNHCYNEAMDNLVSDGVQYNYHDQLSDRISIGKCKQRNESNSFVIADDYMNNVSLMLKSLSRLYGSKQTMIHLVSRPYLLREYFYDVGLTKVSGNDQFQLIPSINLLEQNIIFNVLCEMHNRGLRETILLEHFKNISIVGNSIQEKIIDCLQRVDPNRNYSIDDVYTSFEFTKKTFFYDHHFYEDYVICLKNNDLYQKIMRNIQLVKLSIINVGEKELDCINVNIPQNYIEGQLLIFEGRNYLIRDIDELEGRITVQHARYESPVPVYVQDREYHLNFNRFHCYEKQIHDHLNIGFSTGDMVKKEGISLFCTDITVKTNGYFSLYEGQPFKPLDRYIVIGDGEGMTRSNSFCQCLMLSYQIEENLDYEKITFTLAVLIQEMLKTLFPYLFQYLSVIPVIRFDSFDKANVLENNLRKLYPSCDFFEYDYFKGNGFNVNLVIVEDSVMDVGAVRTVYSEIRVVYNILDDFLTWFLKDKGNKDYSYLYYGQEEIASCFDFEDVQQLVHSLSSRIKDVPISMSEEDMISICECSFCGEIIHSAEYHTYSDGRICCQKCFATNVQEETKLFQLYQDARAYICEKYQISDGEMPRNLVVRFRASSSIAEEGPSVTGTRIVGLAKYAQNELWVETGAPEMNIRETLAHELTHFWQFNNIDYYSVPKKLIEGQASYVGLEYYAYLNNPDKYAKEKEALKNRQDEYGYGYVELCNHMENDKTDNPFVLMQKKYPKN